MNAGGKVLRIGSRGSQLALWQANHVAEALRGSGHTVTIEVIKTTGDQVLDVALAKVGTKGMFTKEIEEALAAGTIDLAVHSLKDLPTEFAPEFTLAAILPREDARDAFVSTRFSGLQQLPAGAQVGTSSLRREAQLRRLRPDLQFVEVRGNVDTRLRKLEAGEYDALILAHAGLLRLGRTEPVREIFAPAVLCPAAGQGALAVECRSDDAGVASILAALDDPSARATTTCERACLAALGGGCQVPIGAYARLQGGRLKIQAVVSEPRGRVAIRGSGEGVLAEAAEVGAQLGADLLRRGAREVLAAVEENFPEAEQP